MPLVQMFAVHNGGATMGLTGGMICFNLELERCRVIWSRPTIGCDTRLPCCRLNRTNLSGCKANIPWRLRTPDHQEDFAAQTKMGNWIDAAMTLCPRI